MCHGITRGANILPNIRDNFKTKQNRIRGKNSDVMVADLCSEKNR